MIQFSLFRNISGGTAQSRHSMKKKRNNKIPANYRVFDRAQKYHNDRLLSRRLYFRYSHLTTHTALTISNGWSLVECRRRSESRKADLRRKCDGNWSARTLNGEKYFYGSNREKTGSAIIIIDNYQLRCRAKLIARSHIAAHGHPCCGTHKYNLVLRAH